MQTHQLSKPKHLKNSRRVGRGGKRGTYSGRGMKGQKSRSGHRIRPAIRDYILKIPKLKGMTRKSNVSKFGSSQKSNVPVVAIKLSTLESAFLDNSSVTPKALIEKNIAKRHKGKMPKVKILSNGELTKKLTIKGIECSKVAIEKIEKAGGSVVEINK